MKKIEVTLLIDCYGAMQIWRGHHGLARTHTTGNMYHTADTGQPSDMLIQNSQDRQDVTSQLSEDERNDLEAGWAITTELYEENIPLDSIEDLFEKLTILQVGPLWYAWRGHQRDVRAEEAASADFLASSPSAMAQIAQMLPNKAIRDIERGYATEVILPKEVLLWNFDAYEEGECEEDDVSN